MKYELEDNFIMMNYPYSDYLSWTRISPPMWLDWHQWHDRQIMDIWPIKRPFE
jgi:hypothetical protein